MTKKEFIQHIIIRALPEMSRLSTTIQYAEQLWESMTFYGYGQGKEPTPRAHKNYYQDLSPVQRVAFDAFWNAFKHKAGRNKAAMRWKELGELSEADYRVIIEAAKKEAARPLPTGQVRLMAEGWLNQRRYEDFTPDPHQAKKQHDLTRVHLENELKNLKNLYALSPNEAIELQIKAMELKTQGLSNTPP